MKHFTFFPNSRNPTQMFFTFHSAHWLRLTTLSCILVSLFASQGHTFSIIEPKDAQRVKPGQIITVRLDPDDLDNLVQSTFFWYHEQEDMLKESAGENLALVSSSTHEPPFGGKLRIPRNAIGPLRLLGIGERASARFRTEPWAIFDEVILHVEPDSKLTAIDFEIEKPLGFGRAALATVYAEIDSLGKIIKLPVVGAFADGVTRPLRLRSTGTTYHSSDENIVIVNPDGFLRLAGNGKAIVTAKNRGLKATLEVVVDVKEDPNEPPEADAGNNQTVEAATRVQLQALNSFDPEGGSLEYHWSQVGGSKVSLLDPYSAKASFLAPFVEDTRTFRFKLRVRDIKGADSIPDFVDIIVEP